jgi:hypothetical protein
MSPACVLSISIPCSPPSFPHPFLDADFRCRFLRCRFLGVIRVRMGLGLGLLLFQRVSSQRCSKRMFSKFHTRPRIHVDSYCPHLLSLIFSAHSPSRWSPSWCIFVTPPGSRASNLSSSQSLTSAQSHMLVLNYPNTYY